VDRKKRVSTFPSKEQLKIHMNKKKLSKERADTCWIAWKHTNIGLVYMN